MIILILLSVIIVLTGINLLVAIFRKSSNISDEIKTMLIRMDGEISKFVPVMRDEFARDREESQRSHRENREEQARSLR